MLARAAVAAGVAGIYMETHPNPSKAKSDVLNEWPLHKMRVLLTTLQLIDRQVRQSALLEHELSH